MQSPSGILTNVRISVAHTSPIFHELPMWSWILKVCGQGNKYHNTLNVASDMRMQLPVIVLQEKVEK
jgi:hypothetical protein